MGRSAYLLVALGLTIGCGGDDGALPPLPTIAELPTIPDLNPDPEILEVELAARISQAELVAGQSTAVYAYNDLTPGPLLHVRVGDRVIVHFTNELAEPTTIHWHGLRIPDSMDGTPMVQAPIMPGGTFTYDFVVPDAGTYWFHPHLNTVEQIDRGLYATLVVAERNAPVFSAERVFMVDDIRLDDAYQIDPYALSGIDATFGRTGNTLLVNGKQVNGAAAVYTATVPHGAVERWRIVNPSGASTFQIGITGASWRIIGTDGGLIPVPYSLDRLYITVGERFDLEVTHDATAPTAELMIYWNDTVVAAQFIHEGTSALAPPVYPTITLPEISATPIDKDLLLGANPMGNFTINGVAHDHQTGHTLEQFQQGVPVRFRIVNQIAPFHPFHLHGQFFQVISRDGVAVNEPGLKDTVLVNNGEEVVIVTNFDNPGRWMYHCHIPEHAELGMMAELEVIETGGMAHGH